MYIYIYIYTHTHQTNSSKQQTTHDANKTHRLGAPELVLHRTSSGVICRNIWIINIMYSYTHGYMNMRVRDASGLPNSSFTQPLKASIRRPSGSDTSREHYVYIYIYIYSYIYIYICYTIIQLIIIIIIIYNITSHVCVYIYIYE